MKCPYCGFLEDRVLDSRAIREGEAIRRRRECLQCGRRFTTHEEIEESQIRVIKKDGRRELFDRAKIMRGLALACHKRPVSSDTLERVTDEIERRIYDRGEREVHAAVIGEMIIEALRALDPVAYVRFASVYREFQDATQFKEVVDMLRGEARPKRVTRSRRPKKTDHRDTETPEDEREGPHENSSERSSGAPRP
jgi:transcriptional repressor NrdR